jgi:hypothetical protein
LTGEQATTFRWLFIKVFNEHTHSQALNQVAEMSWLQLLLVNAGHCADQALWVRGH